MDQTYTAYQQAKGITGEVVEVGLGWGYIASALVTKNDVTGLTSYEKDADRVRDFEAKYGTFPEKHTIVSEDVLVAAIGAGTRFDTAIIDVFDNNTAEFYDLGKNIVTKLLPNIQTGGKFAIEFQSDVPAERDFRAWMESQFGELELEFVHTGFRGTSRYIGYYNV